MTAHLLRCAAESAATPAFGLSSADLVRSTHAASTTACTTAAGQPAAVASHAATPPTTTPSRDGDTVAACRMCDAVGNMTDEPSPIRDTHAAQEPGPMQMHRGHRLHVAGANRVVGEEFSDQPLQPAFLSWSQMRMALVCWLTVVRTRCGLTSGDQHVLHLPCRDSGAIYRVPVALAMVGQETRIVATSKGTAASARGTTGLDPLHPHHADTWIADARAARFVVLARGSQQRIVELLPASAGDDGSGHLVLRPHRMHACGAGHGDAAVLPVLAVPPAADVSAGVRSSRVAHRRPRSVAPIA